MDGNSARPNNNTKSLPMNIVVVVWARGIGHKQNGIVKRWYDSHIIIVWTTVPMLRKRFRPNMRANVFLEANQRKQVQV